MMPKGVEHRSFAAVLNAFRRSTSPAYLLCPIQCDSHVLRTPKQNYWPFLGLFFGQRILSPNSSTTPSLTKYNKPRFTGMVSRQSQLHSGRFKTRSRHLHVIWPTENQSVG